MQDKQTHETGTGDSGNRPYITGELGDWFNLSAQLGQKDQEALALEACLHGLAQQAGQSFLYEKHGEIKTDWPEGLIPNGDLLAHAMKFSTSISSPYTIALLELSGFTDIGDHDNRKSWSWRRYTFTMDALAGMKGEFRKQAFSLGQSYIDNDGTNERIVTKYAQLLFNEGHEAKARQIAEQWMTDNPDADAPQLITFILDKFYHAPEDAIKLATRGIASLAMDQPTANLGNIVLQRALAYDKLAHREAGNPNNSDVCKYIKKASADFDTAEKLPIAAIQVSSISQRRVILTALAKEHGCDVNDGMDIDSGSDSDISEKETAMRLLLTLRTGTAGSDLLEAVGGILKGADKDTAMALYAMILKIAEDDDVPDELRANARFIKDNISISDD